LLDFDFYKVCFNLIYLDAVKTFVVTHPRRRVLVYTAKGLDSIRAGILLSLGGSFMDCHSDFLPNGRMEAFALYF
jgi:hypothetical protein